MNRDLTRVSPTPLTSPRNCNQSSGPPHDVTGCIGSDSSDVNPLPWTTNLFRLGSERTSDIIVAWAHSGKRNPKVAISFPSSPREMRSCSSSGIPVSNTHSAVNEMRPLSTRPKSVGSFRWGVSMKREKWTKDEVPSDFCETFCTKGALRIRTRSRCT